MISQREESEEGGVRGGLIQKSHKEESEGVRRGVTQGVRGRSQREESEGRSYTRSSWFQILPGVILGASAHLVCICFVPQLRGRR